MAVCGNSLQQLHLHRVIMADTSETTTRKGESSYSDVPLNKALMLPNIYFDLRVEFSMKNDPYTEVFKQIYYPHKNIKNCRMDEGSAVDKSDQGTDKKELLINLDLLRNGFSPQPDGQLIMDGYLSAYTEMNKFFQILGTLFQIVSSDVHSKVEILREYRGGEEGDHYHSIQSMITYEKEHDLLINKNRPSGARTLLRLHRALGLLSDFINLCGLIGGLGTANRVFNVSRELEEVFAKAFKEEFVTEFLAILMDGSMEGSFGKNVSELYSCTLGKFHGMLLRTTFSGALLLIPRRETIINRLTNGSAEAEKVAYAEMPDVIEMMKAMYDHTQKLYEENGLLDLP